MKINFGKFKNKKIIIGHNYKMRPTQSRAKSVIFNLLKINNETIVLDLFAGTGLLGFEAASLGAKKVIWFDNNIKSFLAINENIKNLNLDPKKYIVYHSDFRLGLKKIDFKPSLIFLDPPFIAKKYYDEALKYIYENDILGKDGKIILEKNYKLNINYLSKYNIITKRKVGNKDILVITK